MAKRISDIDNSILTAINKRLCNIAVNIFERYGIRSFNVQYDSGNAVCYVELRSYFDRERRCYAVASGQNNEK